MKKSSIKKHTSVNKSISKKKEWLFTKYHFLFFSVIYSILFLLTIRYGSFTDENEQFTAGWFISQGLLPYTDFFSHHGPLPLFLGSIPFLLFGHSLFNFLILRFFVLIFHLCCWSVIWKVSLQKYRLSIGALMCITGILLPVFNLHMMLSTSLVTIILLVLTLLTFQHLHDNKPTEKTVLAVFVIGGFICLWSSIASFIPLFFLSILLTVHWFKQKRWLAIFKQKEIVIGGILLQFLFPVFFLVKNSFQVFWWSVFTYNSWYYFPLHLAQDETEKKYGPIFRQLKQFFTILITAIQEFLNSCITLLHSLFGFRLLLFNGKSTVELLNYLGIVFSEFFTAILHERIILMLSIVILTVSFFLKKKVYGIVFFITCLAFWFRDNELFHLAPIFLLVISALTFQVITLWNKNLFLSLNLSVLLILLTIPLVKVRSEFFQQKENYISPLSMQTAQIIQQETSSNDKVLILNNQIIEYALAERLPASPYYFYFPWVFAVPEIQHEVNITIVKQQPQMVVVGDNFKSEFPSLFKTIEDTYQFDGHTSFFIKR